MILIYHPRLQGCWLVLTESSLQIITKLEQNLSVQIRLCDAVEF